jgi:hypothetical protein
MSVPRVLEPMLDAVWSIRVLRGEKRIQQHSVSSVKRQPAPHCGWQLNMLSVRFEPVSETEYCPARNGAGLRVW